MAKRSTLRLADIAEYPIVTYSAEFSGRTQIDAAFEQEGLDADIRLTAMDADVLKTYMRQGLGIGILSEMAINTDQDPDLFQLKGSDQLFDPLTTKVALRRGALLHSFAYQFVEIFAPGLTAARLRDATLKHSRPGRYSTPETAVPTFKDLQAAR